MLNEKGKYMNKPSWEKTELPLHKKIAGKFKYHLISQALLNQLNRIGITIKPYYWVQEGFQSETPEINGTISDYTVEFLEAEEIKKLGVNPWGISIDKQIADLKAGNKCIALKQNSEIASSMWINLTECSFRPARASLKNDEAYLSSMYTSEAFRGKNLAPYLRVKSYEFLKQIGRNKIYSVTEFFNPSASRYKQKLNARNLMLILYIEIFGKFNWSVTLKTY